MRPLLFALVLVLGACGPMSQPSSGTPPAEPLPMQRPVESAHASPSTQKSAPAKKTSGSVAQQWLDAHNAYRAQHCAPPLTWSKKLADVAQKWANTLRDKGCMFGHSPGAKYGENLAAGTQGALDPATTTAMWYDEIEKYKFPDGGFSMATGHFTQVVWRSTKQVGCAHVVCKGNDIFVCNYDPPGNWEGRYRQEVLPTSCR